MVSAAAVASPPSPQPPGGAAQRAPLPATVAIVPLTGSYRWTRAAVGSARYSAPSGPTASAVGTPSSKAHCVVPTGHCGVGSVATILAGPSPISRTVPSKDAT